MYKKFFLNLFIITIPFLFLILFIDIKVDSALVINNRSDEIANILVSRKNAAIVTVPSKWGSLQKAIVDKQCENAKKPNEIIVFGTSRSSEISSKIFPNNSFFNCAMPGGNILDYIALYGLYKKSKLLPKYLIISIDPWTFHSRKSVMVNKEIQYIADCSIPLKVNPDLFIPYRTGLNYLGIQRKDTSIIKSCLSFDNIIELLNPNYFQLNLEYLFRGTVIATNNLTKESYFIIRSDGGYSLAQQSQIDSLSVKSKSYSFVNIHKSNFFISSDTASIYWSYFEKLLQNLKKDGVIPIIYISPVNPIVYDNLASNSTVELEKSINNLCEKYSILLIGSFNPHKYDYNYIGNYFMDAYHPVKSVVEKIFNCHQSVLKTLGINTENGLCQK